MEQGRIIDGRFELVAPIGEGGMGAVWSARALETGAAVAVKVMDPTLARDPRMVALFRREALAAWATWRSCRVVDVYEIIYDDVESPCLVMELLEGEDLRDLLIHEDRLSAARAAAVTRQICDGLAELHGQGIVHCDLKPENIHVSSGAHERVTILDLGIASFKVSPDGAATRLFGDGEITCTPHYAAPEQLERSSSVDHRADIYAVGVLLYEMLTGRRPYVSVDVDELRAEVLRGELTPPSALGVELPRGLEAVVMRALSRAPEERFRAVDELAEALQPLTAEAELLSFPSRTALACAA